MQCVRGGYPPPGRILFILKSLKFLIFYMKTDIIYYFMIYLLKLGMVWH